MGCGLPSSGIRSLLSGNLPSAELRTRTPRSRKTIVPSRVDLSAAVGRPSNASADSLTPGPRRRTPRSDG